MRRVRRTTLITIFCLACLGGIGLSRKVDFIPTIAALMLLPLVLMLRRRGKAALMAVIVLGMAIGLWRGSVFMQKLDDIKSLSGQKVVIEATALTDSMYGRSSQMEFNAGKLELLQPNPKPLSGSIRVSGFGVPMVYRGDKIQLEGKIYPARGGNQARMSYAKLTRVGADSNGVNKFTRDFAAGVRNALPEPASSFGLGILIGQRSSLPQEVIEQLTIVGLVHIVAVSGYNVTILSRAVARLRLGSKYQRLVLSLSLIGLFILVTGFSASIVRAGIVAGLSLLAWYWGRKINPVTLIAFTAALTGFIKPFYVWSDLGWYLSFLAFFGVLVIAPLLANLIFSRQPKVLMMILIETLCAEIMTLPLIMMIFGQLSLIGLLANLLVVPLVPLAMLLSAIAGIAGTWLPELSGWFAWPANLLLTYILDLAGVLSRLPWAMIKATIAPSVMISFYGAILTIIILLYRRVPRLKENFGKPLQI